MQVLKWPGAKWSLAKEIISLMPKHKIYLEPFFGSGAIFFNKTIVNTEILNDLDSEVVNLFRVIRECPDQLANMVYYTPYSRGEYINSYSRNEKELSPVEKARQFLIRSNMARAGMQYYSSSWRHSGPVLGAKCRQRVTGDWSKLPQRIMKAAYRLKDAEIENTNAIELIKKYNRKDCFIYVDPPYLLSTRRQRYYNVEMTDVKEHEQLIQVLIKHSGPVLLSGYDSELYNDLLNGWSRYEFKTYAEQGKERIEVIWSNQDELGQMALF